MPSLHAWSVSDIDIASAINDHVVAYRMARQSDTDYLRLLNTRLLNSPTKAGLDAKTIRSALLFALLYEEFFIQLGMTARPDLLVFLGAFPNDDSDLIRDAFECAGTDYRKAQEAPTSDAPSAGIDVAPILFGHDFPMATPLGKGSFGEVWKATCVLGNLNVAIKCPRRDRWIAATMQDIRASFLDEAEKMREANCGIKVYQLGELRDGRPYFSMEFCDQSLVQWLDEGRALPELERWRRVVGMGIEILKLLAHMHEKWIVHQDLKPANIMLKDGAPRILDYGLARTRDQVQALGVCRMGTRAYMSPEALTGAPDAKHPHTDLYSFSIILYEVLTGVFPFDDVSGVDVRNRVPKDAPVDPKLKQILWANLTADPKERKCQSASDMRRALEGYLPAKRHQTG